MFTTSLFHFNEFAEVLRYTAVFVNPDNKLVIFLVTVSKLKAVKFSIVCKISILYILFDIKN